MKGIFILALVVIFQLSANCQQIPEKFRIYKVKLKWFDEKKPLKGVFYSFNDSTVFIIATQNRTEISSEKIQVTPISVKNIRLIKVKRKGKSGRSAGIGFISGALLGGISGYSNGDWDSDEMYHPDSQAYFFGAVFGIFGTAIGAISGIPYKEIKINGLSENILKNKKKFDKYSIIKINQSDETNNE